jgi:release factor glutamine methyltransferase
MPDSGYHQAATAPGSATIGEALRAVSATFREAGIARAALDARLLVAEACGLPPEGAITHRNVQLSASRKLTIDQFAARRLGGEPVSRIIGRREFWGLTLAVGPNVLDPRPETELLVETALAHAKAHSLTSAPLRILDLGTGSGCLLAALLSELPKAFGVGVDMSRTALAAAQENLRRLGLCHRAAFLCGDWAAALSTASFDIVVSNPPYIASSLIGHLDREVRGFDPHLALDGGMDGLDAYRALAPQAVKCLSEGALLLLETGRGQGGQVLEIIEKCQDQTIKLNTSILLDLGGSDRAVAGVRQSVEHER